ncbi:MAG TPA: TetR/AcrR family transcriptional regulator [Micromonosporaceae bacterium]
MLDAAVLVFSRRGYHDASVDEIAEAAGISKPMVYAYLGPKEDLFVACLHREGVRLIEALAAAVGQGLTADEQLWQGLRAFFGFVAAHRDGWTVLYRQARGQEPFAEVLAQLRARMVEIVTGTLDRASHTAGLAASEDDLATMAHALIGAAEALADQLVEQPESDPDQIATRLMNAVWMGAGALLRGQRWRPTGTA